MVARGAGRLLRAGGRGGTSLPGKLMLRMDPAAIARLAAQLPRGSVVVSATNGKTTTAAFAAAILDAAGITTVHNVAGANMAGGIASALLDAGADAQLGVFEVDEFWLDSVAAALSPRVLLLGNLFRDQLDRYGELETIGERWTSLVATLPSRLVLNADDPLIADLLRHRGPGGRQRHGLVSRVGLQALPPLWRRLHLRTRLHRPSRGLRLPRMRRAPPDAARERARRQAGRPA